MKQINFELTKDEIPVLKKYFKTSPISLIRHKAQAVIMFTSGLELNQISHLLFKTCRTINRWINDFSNRRLASLFCGHLANENAKKTN